MIRVFLAGEGSSELGSRSGHEAYQTDDRPGVLQCLLRTVAPDGWEIAGAIQWKNIRKLKVNAPDAGDARNVHAAALHARERAASVLAFTRDRDRKPERERDIERAIGVVETGDALRVAGGVAIENIEAWLLALAGEAGSESVRHPENEVGRLKLEAKRAEDYARHVAQHGIDKAPKDAQSLHQWLARARRALSA
jgi:hypothetical protein